LFFIIFIHFLFHCLEINHRQANQAIDHEQDSANDHKLAWEFNGKNAVFADGLSPIDCLLDCECNESRQKASEKDPKDKPFGDYIKRINMQSRGKFLAFEKKKKN